MVADHGTRKRDRWRELDRATGIAGLIATVIIFVPISAISALGEPGFPSMPPATPLRSSSAPVTRPG